MYRTGGVGNIFTDLHGGDGCVISHGEFVLPAIAF